MAERPPIQTEMTPEGEQSLVPGITPITQRDRLQALVEAPMAPRCAQKPLDIGLFDLDARKQLSLF